MKRILAVLGVLAMLANSGASCADPAHSGGEGAAAYESLRGLVGEWKAPLPRGEVMTNVFRPIAFGSALLHEEWKNGEQLTATVFYLVGSELRADHFCDMGNQLSYIVAPKSADPRVLHFSLREATNLDTHPQHFRSTTWQLVDPERHVQDWEHVTPGKEPRIVRLEFARVSAGTAARAAAALPSFAPDAKVFDVPADGDRLVGPLSAQRSLRPSRRAELLDAVSAGDIVVAKLRFADGAPSSKPEYALAIYRLREGLIQDLWHVARSEKDAAADTQEAEEVIRKLAEANNRGDVEAFLALFSPQAKNFRNSGDPHALGDKPSVTMVDAKSRRDAYVKMFANGAPAQVQTLGTVTLGNLIAAREVATLPDGKVLDEISVYRIEDGLILRDWFVFNEARR
jgi:hypothetical protein